ncbi:MAG: nucleotidyltransferase domain-containing protein [Nanoarchaeota archaeon]
MGKKKSIKEKLKGFKYMVNRDIPIDNMILFGSRVKGKKGKDTDIDLIIVSQKFRKLDFFQRGAKMYDYWDLRYPVDFLCYTPEEFNKLKKQITIVREAVKEGIEI